MKKQGNGLLYWEVFLLVKLGCRKAVIELVNPLTARVLSASRITTSGHVSVARQGQAGNFRCKGRVGGVKGVVSRSAHPLGGGPNPSPTTQLLAFVG